MKSLYLDIGNTRAKYRVIDGGEKSANGFCKTDEIQFLVNEMGIEKAFVSCVADVLIRKRLGQLFGEAGVKKIFWAETEKKFGEVVNAYHDYQNLGVDRWLAIVAAFEKFRTSCCVFDFGSAVTVDFIDARGHHGGGYIVPGSALCIASLAQNTAALKPAPVLSRNGSPGTNTESCIQNGIYMQQKGFAQNVLDSLSEEQIVCTGGGFRQLQKVFEHLEYVYLPDLVIDGLQIVSAVHDS